MKNYKLWNYFSGDSKVDVFNSNQDVPFPQANDVSKLVKLCEMTTRKQEVTLEEVMDIFSFTKRQAYLYLNAGIYLGLIIKLEKNRYTSTNTGSMIGDLKRHDRTEKLSKRIISHQPFNSTILHYLIMGVLPSLSEIVVLMMQDENVDIESAETYARRASTVYAWSKWVIENNLVDKTKFSTHQNTSANHSNYIHHSNSMSAS